jgi:hypothetical protein
MNFHTNVLKNIACMHCKIIYFLYAIQLQSLLWQVLISKSREYQILKIHELPTSAVKNAYRYVVVQIFTLMIHRCLNYTTVWVRVEWFFFKVLVLTVHKNMFWPDLLYLPACVFAKSFLTSNVTSMKIQQKLYATKIDLVRLKPENSKWRRKR